MLCTVFGARPIEGSSSTSSFGCDISARPMAVICLLAARGKPRDGSALGAKAREDRVDPLEVARDLGPPRSAGNAAGNQILLDGEREEAVAALEHLDEAESCKFVRTCSQDVVPLKANRSRRDASALGLEEVRDSLERGRLAGAVRADKCDDLAAANSHAHPVQSDDRVLIGHPDAFDGELDVSLHWYFRFGERPAMTTCLRRRVLYRHARRRRRYAAGCCARLRRR